MFLDMKFLKKTTRQIKNLHKIAVFPYMHSFITKLR